MILPPVRVIGALALALSVVTGLGYLASQTILARPGFDPAHPPYVRLRTRARRGRSAPRGGPPGRRTPGRRRLAVDRLRSAPASRRPPCVPTPGCSSPATPAARSAGPRWPASAGWSRTTAPSVAAACVRPAGRPRAILGPALDGRGKFAAIEATPGSRSFHGDERWEHAVGPMQFLPESWRSWATDGDGDGRRRPRTTSTTRRRRPRATCARAAATSRPATAGRRRS